MQKVLLIILGVLGIVLLVELGVLVWQKNTSPSQFSVPLSPTITPVSIAPLLPMSQQNKKDIRFVSLTDEYTKDGYIGWQDADFFYYAKKENKELVYPFSFVGAVKKIENNQLEIEAKGNDTVTHLVKIELLPRAQVIKQEKSSPGELKIGSKVRIARLNQHKIKNGFFLVNKINIL